MAAGASAGQEEAGKWGEYFQQGGGKAQVFSQYSLWGIIEINVLSYFLL